MSRAKWKGPFVDLCMITLDKKRYFPNVWSRSSVIPRRLANTVLSVYNGKNFIRVPLTKQKIGYKLGEYSYTRKQRKKKLPLKDFKSKRTQAKKK